MALILKAPLVSQLGQTGTGRATWIQIFICAPPLHLPSSTSHCNLAGLRAAWNRVHGGVDADANAVDLLARLAKHVPAQETVFISGIFDSLAGAGLLDTPNLAQLTEALCAAPGRLEALCRELAELAIPHQISRPDGSVFELQVLTRGNFEDRLQGETSQSHTCQARVYGAGLADGKSEIKQQRWAAWCRAAEAWVERHWQAGAPLTDIVRDVAAIRHHIAHLNETENADRFGKFKTSADRYNAMDRAVPFPARRWRHHANLHPRRFAGLWHTLSDAAG